MLRESVTRWDADLLPTLIARFDQIDVALRHCLDNDDEPTRALLLYAVLWGIVHQARVDEVLTLGAAVVERWPDSAVRHGADAAATYAMGLLLAGQAEAARTVATGALPHSGASVLAAPNLRRVLALAARRDGDHERAEALLAEAAAAAAERGIVTVDLECRTYRAQDLSQLGRHDEALAIVRDVADQARDRRSILNEVWARTVEASIRAGQGHHDEAVDVATATLLVSRAIDYPFGIICNLQTLAAGHLASGELPRAAEAAEQLLDAVARSGSGDFRRALDVVTAVLTAGRTPGRTPAGRHRPAPPRHQPDDRPAAAGRATTHCGRRARPAGRDAPGAARPGRAAGRSCDRDRR